MRWGIPLSSCRSWVGAKRAREEGERTEYDERGDRRRKRARGLWWGAWSWKGFPKTVNEYQPLVPAERWRPPRIAAPKVGVVVKMREESVGEIGRAHV